MFDRELRLLIRRARSQLTGDMTGSARHCHTRGPKASDIIRLSMRLWLWTRNHLKQCVKHLRIILRCPGGDSGCTLRDERYMDSLRYTRRGLDRRHPSIRALNQLANFIPTRPDAQRRAPLPSGKSASRGWILSLIRSIAERNEVPARVSNFAGLSAWHHS